MSTRRITRPAAPLAIALAGAALLAPAGALAANGTQRVPPRHVICSKTVTWVPMDYDGGCFLTFSQAIKRSAYGVFSLTAADDSEWAGANTAAAVSTMRCTRGGTVNGMKLNRFQSGTCVWNETYQHVGYDTPPEPHANHQWQCEVTMVITSAPAGKTRGRPGRMSMQWKVSSTPLQDLTRTDGEFPFCNKSVPDDAWL